MQTIHRIAAPPTSTSVEALTTRECLSSNDEIAALVSRYSRLAFRVAFRILASAADAEDVVQEATWKASLKAHQFRHESSLKTWYLKIVVNEARQYKRAQWRYVYLESLEELSPAFLACPLGKLIQEERANDVASAIASLPETYRITLRLRLANKSADEISKELKVNVATVKSRLFRAKQMVAQRVDSYLNRDRGAVSRA